MKTAREIAQTLVDRQVALHAEGKDGAKDVMSILSKYTSQNVHFRFVYLPVCQLERIYQRIRRGGSKMRRS